MRKYLLLALAAVCCLCACRNEHEIGIVAHRGYWNCEEGGMSHNSIASLRAACEKGYWGTEFDVKMTADSQLVVFHDKEIGGKVVTACTLEELALDTLPNGEHIPTLAEYLEVAKEYPETKLVFELKKHDSDGLEDKAVDLSVEELKKAGMFDPDRIIFISFSLRQCARFAAAAPGFTVQYLDSDHSFEEMDSVKVNGIDMQYSTFLGDPSWNEGARKRGYGVNVWTVDKEEDIRACIAAGVDMITTNEPELVRRLLAETPAVREKSAK